MKRARVCNLWSNSSAITHWRVIKKGKHRPKGRERAVHPEEGMPAKEDRVGPWIRGKGSIHSMNDD